MEKSKEVAYIESNFSYAYLRVSTKDQSLDRQLDAIKHLNLHHTVIETESGKNFADRPQYQAMKTVMLRKGDTLYVKELDRLGRNFDEIIEEWRYFSDNGIFIVIMDMELLDTRKYKDGNGMEKVIANIILVLLSWVAEKERETTLRRAKEGIQSRRDRGLPFGAPKKQFPEFESMYQRVKAGEITAAELQRQLGMLPNTYHRRVKELEASHG